jgi:hypothetical protein
MRVRSYFSWLVLKSNAAYRNIARACLVHMSFKITVIHVCVEITLCVEKLHFACKNHTFSCPNQTFHFFKITFCSRNYTLCVEKQLVRIKIILWVQKSNFC